MFLTNLQYCIVQCIITSPSTYPANYNVCTVHLVNDGVKVNGDSATVDFSSSGPSHTYLCSLDRQALAPCE